MDKGYNLQPKKCKGYNLLMVDIQNVKPKVVGVAPFLPTFQSSTEIIYNMIYMCACCFIITFIEKGVQPLQPDILYY